MDQNVKAEIDSRPYLKVIADLLISQGNPTSTLFDLRDELQLQLNVVETMISRYGESTSLTDETTHPVA